MLFSVDREPSRYPAYLLLLRRRFGAEPLAHGLVRAEALPDPEDLGCIRGGFEPIVDAPDIEALVEALEAAHITEGPFLLDHVRLGRHRDRVASLDQVRRAADALQAWPDLKNPAVRFAILETPDRLYFTRERFRIKRPGQSPYADRPWGYSAALSPELAITAVHLVAEPGQTLVDPTCGSGTILYEALKRGIDAWGYDLKWRWAAGSRQNLEHFGFTPPPHRERLASVADAREVEFEADAVIANLPYGRKTVTSDEKLQAILHNVRPRARRFVFFSGASIVAMMERAGYREIEEVDLSKGPARQRFMTVAE